MTRDEIAALAKQYADEVVNQGHYWRKDRNYTYEVLQVSRAELAADIAFAIRQALVLALGGVEP